MDLNAFVKAKSFLHFQKYWFVKAYGIDLHKNMKKELGTLIQYSRSTDKTKLFVIKYV